MTEQLPTHSAVEIIERAEERFPQIAWRTTAPEYDFVNRWSLEHRYEEGTDPDRVLCGAKIRWNYVGSGDGTRCKRCDRIAVQRVEREVR